MKKKPFVCWWLLFGLAAVVLEGAILYVVIAERNRKLERPVVELGSIAEDVWNGFDKAGIFKVVHDIFVMAMRAIIVVTDLNEKDVIWIKFLDYNINNASNEFHIGIAKEIKNHILNYETAAITKEDIRKNDK